ncbi:MAG TPA: sulfatase-like hydrolase/transferase [Bacteroidales bacterium]|nr:sulfatase-like hydrolase/transferase [Bacteroidales bacterium]HQM69321.1 sulfatase-like hydrolase/transferase [Bacteroidales bacterium]
MKKRITAIFFYGLFWLSFFVLARLIFILTQYREAFEFSTASLLLTFRHGMLLDFSAVGYVMIIPLLLLIPEIYFNWDWYSKFVKWYTYIILAISSAIVISDTLLYKYWGFRMDYTPLIYLKTPKAAMASVTTFQFFAVLTTIILLSALFIYLYRKLINGLFEGFERVRLWFEAMLFFLVLWGSLLIPIRGGIGIAPINAGTVYFSDEMFLNHAAINVVWNVGSSVFNQKPVRNPYQFVDTAEAKAITDSLIKSTGEPVKLLNNSRPNILMIVIESFGSAFIEPLSGDSLTTPFFNRYIKEGILFSHFYASGSRTDKAIPAILCGYPAQPAVSVMKEPQKTQSLPGIVKDMEKQGYNSSFWYGGEINFANFNSFVKNAGFDQVITMDNFSPEFYNSKWGVHDHVLLAALRDSMKNIEEPFIKVVLTLSSHEPFEVPMDPVFKGSDDFTKFRNSIHYTDRSLGEFLDWARTTGWWKNTLVVLVADHCRRNSTDIQEYSEEIYKIPMLWLGGALAQTGITIEKTGSQVDIPLTILRQLGLDGDYPFSKDLLSAGSGSFAFYTFNEGFGFITDSSKYIYEHKLGDSVIREGKDPDTAGRNGKAFLQVLYDDFLKR